MVTHEPTRTVEETAVTSRCPTCTAPVAREDHFCEGCGARLWTRQAGTADADADATRAAEPRACVRCGATGISADGYCDTCGQRQPRGRDRVERDLGLVAGVSDKGHHHHRNEDAMAFGHIEAAEGGVTVVAVVSDGVSSSERPDDASQAAADTGLGVLLDALRSGGEATAATRAAGVAAAGAVAALGAGTPGTAPSCTYVSAVVDQVSVTVGWVGDSRAYWLAAPSAAPGSTAPGSTAPGSTAPGAATPGSTAPDTAVPPKPSACLTVDDSWAAQVVAAGLLDAAEAYADRRAHALARWFGADNDDVEPRVVSIRPGAPGVVLVCSDGLWNYLWAAEDLAAAVLPGALADPLEAARALTRLALDAGGHDNVTVVVVPFPPAAPQPADPHGQTR